MGRIREARKIVAQAVGAHAEWHCYQCGAMEERNTMEVTGEAISHARKHGHIVGVVTQQIAFDVGPYTGGVTLEKTVKDLDEAPKGACEVCAIGGEKQ